MKAVRFKRKYDRYKPGQVATLTDGVADALCSESGDGKGPYAEPLDAGDNDTDEESE